mgnify:CR=1 FL=1
MIRVSLAQLVAVYLCLFLGCILTLWLSYGARRQFRQNRRSRNRLQCTVCGLAYEDRSAAIVPECPRCLSRNERTPEIGI